MKKLNVGVLIGIILFLILLPLVLKINFYQNDDWVYYKIVEDFRSGNFSLDPISAPTFYFQGLLGTVFSFIFGIHRLPVLTLVVSVMNFFLLYKILQKSTKLGEVLSVLVALVWFANPLNIYSTLGFMTENYLLLGILASLYYFDKFNRDGKRRDFIFFNLCLFCALITKQSALALAAAYPLYYLLNKNQEYLSLQSLTSISFFLFYFFLFPKTSEMYEKPLQFHHLLDSGYVKQLCTAITIYISAFCGPLVAVTLFNKSRKTSLSIFIIVMSLVLFLGIFKEFKPNKLAWQEFFYLDNVLERRGFYSRGILGTKYYFKGMYDLYRYWDVAAKFLAGFVILILVLPLRRLKNQAHLLTFFAIYLLLMILAERVYDRYLPPLFLSFLLISLGTISEYYRRITFFVLIVFLAFEGFYSYQLAVDFVLTNKHVWERSLELSQKEKISPKLIQGTNAWKLSNYNAERNYLYDFSFDNTTVNSVYAENYILIEKKKIKFPASIWIDPYVYLYKKKSSPTVII